MYIKSDVDNRYASINDTTFQGRDPPSTIPDARVRGMRRQPIRLFGDGGCTVYRLLSVLAFCVHYTRANYELTKYKAYLQYYTAAYFMACVIQQVAPAKRHCFCKAVRHQKRLVTTKWGTTAQHHIRSYHSIPYHTIPYHTILYHTISYHTIPGHTKPCYTRPGHVIPD
jgi:hypothetical protein